MLRTGSSVSNLQKTISLYRGDFLEGFYLRDCLGFEEWAVLERERLRRIAEAIDFPFKGTDSLWRQLLAHMGKKEMLLVFDNLEHLLNPDGDNAATFLAALLNEAPDITMLATSRERLNLYEERLFAMSGLAVPALDAPRPEQYSAVALFLQRVQRLKHGFSPSPEETAAIVNVCRLLEGAPLAIELAAGWALQHSCQAIAAETATSLDFLHTAYRNVPARQRSLRAVFDHSRTLLPPDLQTVFACLAIFPDTFETDAAVTIAGATTTNLAALMDKSLLQQQPNGRYHIHSLLQQFAPNCPTCRRSGNERRPIRIMRRPLNYLKKAYIWRWNWRKNAATSNYRWRFWRERPL